MGFEVATTEFWLGTLSEYIFIHIFVYIYIYIYKYVYIYIYMYIYIYIYINGFKTCNSFKANVNKMNCQRSITYVRYYKKSNICFAVLLLG